MKYKISRLLRDISLRKYLLVAFIAIHVYLAIVLGRLYAFAPDEIGYLFTFNNIYQLPINLVAQSGSGWITAPTIFLWVLLFPAKIMSLMGVTDVISLRILSIAVTTFSLNAILRIQNHRNSNEKLPQLIIFSSFMIPSVFLWTTLGMREPFIIFFLTLFFCGLHHAFEKKLWRSFLYVLFGSYGLLSTKPYLWICLVLAVLISLVIQFSFRRMNLRFAKFLLITLLLSFVGFASTTSTYALNFLFNSKISETSTRSGDSISKITVEVGSEAGSEAGSEVLTEKIRKLETITFHGDYTLVALRTYLLEHPNSLFTRALTLIGIDKSIERIYIEKVRFGLSKADKSVGLVEPALNGHILEPANIRNPVSILRAASIFLLGPFPFFLDYGFAANIAALESPMWWGLYGLVFAQVLRLRKSEFFTSYGFLFPFIFLLGEIALSALVEVNLGTSFRHRSIILIPLLFIYISCRKFNPDKNEFS